MRARYPDSESFMVFAELTASEPFDLWVGDEAWDIDYFLHENPELKRAPYGRPFIYVPLRHHFEQNFHVRHRLDRYGAGRCLDYDQTGPEALAQAIAAEIGRPVSYRPVETDGAARAAALLAELI